MEPRSLVVTPYFDALRPEFADAASDAPAVAEVAVVDATQARHDRGSGALITEPSQSAFKTSCTGHPRHECRICETPIQAEGDRQLLGQVRSLLDVRAPSHEVSKRLCVIE